MFCFTQRLCGAISINKLRKGVKLKMSSENGENGETKKKVIEVRHTGLPSSEGELKRKLAEKEDLLKRVALEKFTKEKDELLEQARKAGLDEDKIATIEDAIVDPSSLEVTKEWVGIITKALGEGGNDEDEERKLPSGRAPLQPSGRYESFRQLVDELYNTVQNPKASTEEKKLANSKINQLFVSFIRGQKERLRQHGSISPIYVMDCPQCKSVMFGSHCESCGYDLPKHELGD